MNFNVGMKIMSRMDAPRTHSLESEVDRNIDDLVGKIIEGNGTPEDRIRLEELVAQRTRLMQPDRYNPYRTRRRYA